MKHLYRTFTAAWLAFALALPAFAAGMSDALENKLADHEFRGMAYTAPTVLCVRLNTTASTDAAAGTEATYTGYARGQLNPSFSNWAGTGGETTNTPSAGTGGTVSNAVQITVGSAATSGPTVVTSFDVMDSCTIGAGVRKFYASLTANKTINNGDPAPVFPIGALTVQFDN